MPTIPVHIPSGTPSLSAQPWSQQTPHQTAVRLQQPAATLPAWVSSAQLQGWRWCSLSGTSAPLLGWPHVEEDFFLASHQNVRAAALSIVSRRVLVLSPLWHPRRREQPNPLVAFQLSKPTSLSLSAQHPLAAAPDCAHGSLLDPARAALSVWGSRATDWCPRAALTNTKPEPEPSPGLCWTHGLCTRRSGASWHFQVWKGHCQPHKRKAPKLILYWYADLL